ncbi:MAG: CoA transferase subunit A [Bacteroidales bacterium]|jgi:acetate CoA/acetoacetate CoA-transferase alpha subunit|nr:CoA transferase subunit A [Bacteroidales bacterium]
MKKIEPLTNITNYVKDGMSIMVGGFMGCGTPEAFIDLLVKQNIKDLTIICNDAGYPDKGVGKLIVNHQVSHLIASHIGLNPVAGQQMSEGTMNVTLVPQGTLAEQIRAAGAGLGGILTPTGVGTIVEEGKQKITLNGKDYLLEEALHADIALIYATASDKYGNLIHEKTTRNFNPIMALGANKVIALTRTVRELDPNCVMTPHVLVHHLMKEEN